MRAAVLNARLGRAAAYLLLLLALAPLTGLLLLVLQAELGTAPWPRGTIRLLGNTVLLAAGAGLLAVLWGTAAAWLTEMCVFPGRRVFGLLLFLPFALPPYLQAYVWGDLLDDRWGWGVRNMPGACLLMSLALYPYVYMLARANFAQQSCSLMAAARLLGCTPWGAFWRVALPMARPALGVGALLAFMEAANDIAVAQDFGLGTLGYRAYDLWFNRGSAAGAASLASLLLVLAVALIMIERPLRRRQVQYESSIRYFCCLSEYRLRGRHALLACMGCGVLVLLGCGVPLAVLAARTLETAASWHASRLAGAVIDTLQLVGLVLLAGFALGAALLWLRRRSAAPAMRMLCMLPSSGYALPGIIYGMGCLLLLAAAADGLLALSGYSAHWLLHSSVGLLCLALACRYVIIPGGALERGLDGLSPRLGDVARSTGKSQLRMLAQVWLPLLRPSLLAGGLLLAVDIIKELPLTLLLRPLGTDTLALLVYQYASDEDLSLAAPYALVMSLLALALLGCAYPLLTAAVRKRIQG